MIERIASSLALLALSACSNTHREVDKASEVRAAVLTPEPARPLQIVQIPQPLALPGQLKPLPDQSEKTKVAPSMPPQGEVDRANTAARIEPTFTGFINAMQVWPYSPAALYQVYASAGQVTDLVFQVGEHLTDVSASDTVRWVIGDTKSGTAAAEQSHLIVKPTRAGLHANLIVTTDRRTYYIELKSEVSTWMAAVSWEYPQDQLQALKRENTRREAQVPVDVGVSLDQLRFRYEIAGDAPSWRPVRAFDDGNKVYIEFPNGIAQTDMPPLFIVGIRGVAELVNYRRRGVYYIVDRLFDAAELRLGAKHAEVVRILRTDVALDRRQRKARS